MPVYLFVCTGLGTKFEKAGVSRRRAQKTGRTVSFGSRLEGHHRGLTTLHRRNITFPGSFHHSRASSRLRRRFSTGSGRRLRSLGVRISITNQVVAHHVVKGTSFMALRSINNHVRLCITESDLPRNICGSRFGG